MNDDYPNNVNNPAVPPITFPHVEPNESVLLNCRVFITRTDYVMAQNVLVQVEGSNQAYWLRQFIRDAQYGEVWFAIVLRRDHADADWEVTEKRCAVKEMRWDDIRNNPRGDNPRTEVNVMSFMSNAMIQNPVLRRNIDEIQEVMNRFNVLLPMDDPLTTQQCLYAILPFCNGGELFERLDEADRFTEPQARYWFTQVLNGVGTLQFLGLCHRDISLENILIHDNQCYIIDYGMTIGIPYANIPNEYREFLQPDHRGERGLIIPSGPVGTHEFMSPEIFMNNIPFDGHVVDLYTLGVILLRMVTGVRAWERPAEVDISYRVIAHNRQLARLLRVLHIQLSPACINLLQMMLVFEPQERLSLAQIRAHEWMQGPVEPPPLHG